MQVPDYLHKHVSQLIGIETDAAISRSTAERRHSFWAVIYGLKPVKDGDKWCVLLGDDIQTGVCGFGDTPEEAIEAFEIAMNS